MFTPNLIAEDWRALADFYEYGACAETASKRGVRKR
jgi:hypothetical protein